MPKSPEQISKITREQRPFLIEEIELKPRFFVSYRVQVDQAEIWLLYRDGLFKKQLGPGLHKWWSRLFHKWRAQKINKHVEILYIEVKARVKGPSMPSEVAGGTAYELACDVIVELEITCKIAEIENFIQYSQPISVFCNAIQDMVYEYVGRLSYDQYGQWATEIRNWTKNLLGPRGRFDAERRVGLTVEDVFVKEFKPYTEYDDQVLSMFQLVEQSKKYSVWAESFAKQGEILNISPSILALKNSPIGRALIERDAELRRLMVATGINPSISVQQKQDTMGQSESRQTSSLGYLNPPRLPVAGRLPNGPTSAQEVTGQIFPVDLPGATHPFSVSTQDTLKDLDDSYVDVARQEQELTELGRTGFQVAGRGKPVPTYDAAGLSVPGSKAWELTVSQPRATGNLTMMFHCPPGYPNTAPSVRVQSPMGGGYQSTFPNTIHEWNAGRMLADVAREIADSNP